MPYANVKYCGVHFIPFDSCTECQVRKEAERWQTIREALLKDQKESDEIGELRVKTWRKGDEHECEVQDGGCWQRAYPPSWTAPAGGGGLVRESLPAAAPHRWWDGLIGLAAPGTLVTLRKDGQTAHLICDGNKWTPCEEAPPECSAPVEALLDQRRVGHQLLGADGKWETITSPSGAPRGFAAFGNWLSGCPTCGSCDLGIIEEWAGNQRCICRQCAWSSRPGLYRRAEDNSIQRLVPGGEFHERGQDCTALDSALPECHFCGGRRLPEQWCPWHSRLRE